MIDRSLSISGRDFAFMDNLLRTGYIRRPVRINFTIIVIEDM